MWGERVSVGESDCGRERVWEDERVSLGGESECGRERENEFGRERGSGRGCGR